MEDNSFMIGDRVIVSDFNNLVGEITKKSETVDGEYTYFVYYEDGRSNVWVEAEDLILA
jgi:hypothetical protein